MHHNASGCIILFLLIGEFWMGFDFSSDDVLLDINEVCKKLSISRSTLERLRRTSTSGFSSMRTPAYYMLQDDEFAGLPSFPEPTITLGRSPRWSARVLNNWINSLPKR